MARKKHHKEHHEEHADETWLVPYSDLLTLMLALFIVLFASAQVDQKKFEQLAASFNSAFTGSPNSVLNNNQSIVDSYTPSGGTIQSPDKAKNASYMRETVQLMEAKKEVDRYIQESKMQGDLQTVMTQDGLMIRIKDNTLFNSGSAELLPKAKSFGKEIAHMLARLPQKVVISGHTDNVPIHTKEFPSNWELSSARAINFMKYILSQANLQPERFSAIGYGQYHPVASNDTAAGRQKNRRVEILIMRSSRM
jgi:chemotaxis protein MotB